MTETPDLLKFTSLSPQQNKHGGFKPLIPDITVNWFQSKPNGVSVIGEWRLTAELDVTVRLMASDVHLNVDRIPISF